MIWETTIQFVGIDKKGNDKTIKEKYVVLYEELFGTVEVRLHEKFGHDHADFDVADIKRSNIREVANKREHDDDLLWLATLQDTFVDENTGEEKATNYKVLFFAQTFDTAKTFISEYIRQGYNLELVGLKLTKFIDVL